MTVKVQAIKEITPHRYPFLMIDRVLDYRAGDFLLAIKNVTINEEYFSGHFPEKPIMPGVMMLEALGQASGLLIFYTINQPANVSDNWYYFAGADRVRFKRVVEPGDQLKLETKVLKRKRNLWVFDTKALVEDQIACSAELLIIRSEGG